MTNILVISNYSEKLFTDIDKYQIIRAGTNKPEIRQHLIIQTLYHHYTIVRPEIKLTLDKLIELNVHSKEYLNFLNNCYSSWEQEPDDQYIGPSNGLIPLTTCLNRSNEHYNKIISKLSAYRQLGYFCDDTMTPIYKNTFDVALQSANNGFVINEYIDNYDVIYLSNTFPGHHAKFNSMGGYCFLNNAAIGAEVLKNNGYKVCILDIDYHHGNGQRDIYLNKDLLTVSIHASPSHDFPLYEGYEDEEGDNNMNIIFPKKAQWLEYEQCLQKALNKINEYNPDVIVLCFGFDTYEKDIDASVNYGCCLKIDDYIKIGQAIKKLNKKVVICQEGGYYIDDAHYIVENLLKGFQ
jgi:acetoin utilization deacetylase AcuC-like enzyme